MAFQMFSDDDSIYLTAPTTPTTPYHENLNFYSALSSPILHAYKPTFAHAQIEPTTPKCCTYDYYDNDYEDESNNFIEFKFETSSCFTLDDYDFDQMVQCFESPCHQKPKESLSAMAFADELFHDRKVIPLKPPPRLQKGSYNNLSSCLSLPKCPTAALELPFLRRRLWNDDFDPFMVALEKIKRGNRETKNKVKNQRRARSVSPLQARNWQRPNESMNFHYSDINQFGPNKNTLMEPDGPHSICARYRNKKIDQESKKGPIRLGEAKGVLNAKQTRLVKVRHEKAKKGGSAGEKSEESRSRGSKRERIEKLLFRFASIGIANNEEKQKDESVKKIFKKKLNRFKKVVQ